MKELFYIILVNCPDDTDEKNLKHYILYALDSYEKLNNCNGEIIDEFQLDSQFSFWRLVKTPLYGEQNQCDACGELSKTRHQHCPVCGRWMCNY